LNARTPSRTTAPLPCSRGPGEAYNSVSTSRKARRPPSTEECRAGVCSGCSAGETYRGPTPDCLPQLGVPSCRWTSAAAGTVGEGAQRPVIWRTACRRSSNLYRSQLAGAPGVHEALGPIRAARGNSGCTQICPSVERGGSNGWAVPQGGPHHRRHRAGRRPSRRASSIQGLQRPRREAPLVFVQYRAHRPSHS
jgi:hypothetical protein